MIVKNVNVMKYQSIRTETMDFQEHQTAHGQCSSMQDTGKLTGLVLNGFTGQWAMLAWPYEASDHPHVIK